MSFLFRILVAAHSSPSLSPYQRLYSPDALSLSAQTYHGGELSHSRPSAALSSPSSFDSLVEGDDGAAGMIARAKFQGQCTSPGIERAGFVIPVRSRSDFFYSSTTEHVISCVLKYLYAIKSIIIFLDLFNKLDFHNEHLSD